MGIIKCVDIQTSLTSLDITGVFYRPRSFILITDQYKHKQGRVHWVEVPHVLEHTLFKLNSYLDLEPSTRVFFTRKSARFYAFRYKSTPSTVLPSMLARTKICKRTRSRLSAISAVIHCAPSFSARALALHSLYGIMFCVSSISFLEI